MTRIVLLLSCLALVSGCSVIRNGTNALSGGARQSFDGNQYRARLVKNDEAPQQFAVVVGDLDKGLAGAKEAGRYEATKYCLKNYSVSDVNWTVGPDMDDAALPIADGRLELRGECVGWL